MSQRVILVNEFDQVIGTEEKLNAHQTGKLHRAFSVFVFYEEDGELKLLIQQRQHNKYHCGGLWTNTCCSHPQPGEEIVAAGERRLQEEIGISVALKKVGEFQYTAHFENGLTENEYDHVLVGIAHSATVAFNQKEVAAVCWISIPDLLEDIEKNPVKYTPWFKPALEIALGS